MFSVCFMSWNRDPRLDQFESDWVNRIDILWPPRPAYGSTGKIHPLLGVPGSVMLS
jgi:hypothetical protein